jgi:peptidoglycan/xylan/chitin deacetylase (PgdA/CDA1 family)
VIVGFSQDTAGASPRDDLLAIPAEHFLHERYAGSGGRSSLVSAYYVVKPLLPRGTQLALRRAYARKQRQRAFPAWPIEPVLVERLHAELLARIRESGGTDVRIVDFWPAGHEFAYIITHDVEGPEGVRNIPALLEIEQRHGVVSSWNFVAEWYPIPDGTFAALRAAGCEIGLHGIKHDGRLFESRQRFEAELPKIHHYLEAWDAEGFRSPATGRNAAWMHELGCRYDSSFPDTDPFEPQSGGCCSIFPYFFGDVVELPITLVQDHTLFEILREPTIDLWLRKSAWVIANHGLVNVIVHPDYVHDPQRLDRYDELLAFLTSRPGGWHALPRDVARWWRARAELEVGEDGRIAGPPPHGFEPTVAMAREAEGARVIFPAHG